MADDFGSLGGASFKIVADAAAFMKGMDDAEKKAASSSSAIGASVATVGKAVEGYAVQLTKVEQAYDLEVKGAMAVTRAHKEMLASQDAIRRALEETTVAAKASGVAAAGAGAGAAAMGRAGFTGGLGFLYLSQAIEDAQYGFSAIVNNIPLIVMGMGGSAGIAGAASIAAVAINQLLKHTGDLTEALASRVFGENAKDLQDIADRAKKGADAFKDMADALASVAKERGAAFKGSTIEAGGGAKGMASSVAGAMAEGGMVPEQTEGKRFGSFLQGMFTSMGIFKGKAQRTQEKAEEVVGRAGAGDKTALEDIRRLVKEHPGQFNEGQKAAIAHDPEVDKAWEGFHKGAAQMRDIHKKDEDLAKEATKKTVAAAIGAREEHKRLRLQDLEDKKDAIQKEKHQIAEDLYTKLHERRPGQVLAGGAKAAIDMYQSSAPGFDSPKELAKKAHKLQEDANKRLVSIDEQLKKERRVIIPH